mmetsp:Transcript_12112/g.34663  ORF Transcript_12112/g.34663 Transcript_12112/m.34663 type:complete len:198 (+) Transcript_12112:5485-6078(+)
MRCPKTVSLLPSSKLKVSRRRGPRRARLHPHLRQWQPASSLIPTSRPTRILARRSRICTAKVCPGKKIDEAIKKVYEDTKKAEAEAKKSAKVEYGRASSSDDSSDHQSRNTASTSASSGVTANAPSTPKKKRSFRPTSVAKKVRSALAGGKGNGGWTASAPRTMPISSNNVDDGESALASFAALQDALDSVISERKD